MRRAVLAASFCALAFPAGAQELAKPMVFKMTVEQAQLVVQTLGAISCRSVGEMATCQQAVELLRSIREQAKAQEQ